MGPNMSFGVVVGPTAFGGSFALRQFDVCYPHASVT